MRGQASIELAVFGALLIMVLGVLINYGLTYGFNQQAMMESFRQALADSGGEAGTGNRSVVKDRHLPSPSSPFAIGSVTPVSASASVVRDYRMQETADDAGSLPTMTITIQDTIQDQRQPSGFRLVARLVALKTAGFRTEPSVCGFIKSDGKHVNDPENVGPIDRYEEIYGAGNIRQLGGSDTCRTITILDACEGEVISRDGCIRQARLIVDDEVCRQQCEKGKPPGSEKDCGSLCRQPITVPWYAQGHRETNPATNTYVFPRLDALFAGIRGLGLQPNYLKRTQMDHLRLTKQETDSGITSTTSGTLREETTRSIVAAQNRAQVKQPVATSKEVPTDASWTTSW